MAVIVDDGVRKEVARLEAAGNFSLAGQFKKASEVSLESLAFQTTVPAEYAALVENSAAFQAMRAQHEEKAKREKEQTQESKERMAELRQQEIDAQIFRFNIGGEDYEISQGDLRKIMEQRVEALEKRKRELLRNGGSAEEVQKVQRTLDTYKPAIRDLKDGTPGGATVSAIKTLKVEDPEFTAALEQHQRQPANSTPSTSAPTTSFSGSFFRGEGIAGPQLTTMFTASASPSVAAPNPTAAPPPVTPEQTTQKNKNTLQNAGF